MRKPKPAPCYAEHIRYGRCEILAVRELDSGGGVFVADVRFADGSERTIRLASQFWKSGIASLLPKLPKKKATQVEAA